jgi:hypothetical protein
VLRARGWRLYTEGGKRLVDLWQYGGRALLGHTPPQLLRAFKNVAERGLFAPLPNPAEGRLYRALSRLLPRRGFRLYRTEAALEQAVAAGGFSPSTVDPALGMDGAVPENCPLLWRPWLRDPAVLNPGLPVVEGAPLLIPVLPLPFPGAPAILALDPALEDRFPPVPPLSPAAAAAGERAVLALLAAPGRSLTAALDRVLTAGSFWKRRGIYLHYDPVDAAASAGNGPAPEYKTVFMDFLAGGFLLPPSREEPAIIPGELSAGEGAQLAKLAGGQD